MEEDTVHETIIAESSKTGAIYDDQEGNWITPNKTWRQHLDETPQDVNGENFNNFSNRFSILQDVSSFKNINNPTYINDNTGDNLTVNNTPKKNFENIVYILIIFLSRNKKLLPLFTTFGSGYSK